MLLRLARWSAALFSAGSFVCSYAQADTISTWNSGMGNWSNASQWTPARVPNNQGNQGYAVTINNGAVVLDLNPTINTLTIKSGAGLTAGYDASGQYTTLTVNHNATVNGGIDGPSYNNGFFNTVNVGGNLSLTGGITMGGELNVAGNMQNSGNLGNFGFGGPFPGFTVGGTLLNTGSGRPYQSGINIHR